MNKTSFAGRMIARSDAEAEMLIGRVRMFVAGVIFIALTALITILPPETYALRQAELIAGLVVSFCYSCLGAASFLVARSKFYKPVHGLLFALAEVALVLFNTLFDVLNPDTSSLFALASPLLLVIAIVLVLQVLRYNLKIHITVSVLVILGLFGILLYDPQIGQAPSPRLVDEVLNLYSVPPNVLRVFMLSLLAVIVALAISRSRSLMEKIAHELEESQNRNRFLPSELTTHLSDEDISELRTGRTEQVVVMMVDLRGFTKLALTLTPQQTAELLNSYRSIVMDVVTRNQGIIDKFMGDGVMCVFGLEQDFENASTSAVKAAIEISALMETWNTKRALINYEKLNTVIAIGGGEAFIAALGPPDRLEFTAIGPAVNSVSRMEAHAKEVNVEILISKIVYEAQTLDQGIDCTFTPIGKTRFRGEEQETELWSLQKGAQ